MPFRHQTFDIVNSQDVLEHIPINEIQDILNSFRDLNDRFELIVSIPTENFISRKMRKNALKK